MQWAGEELRLRTGRAGGTGVGGWSAEDPQELRLQLLQVSGDGRVVVIGSHSVEVSHVGDAMLKHQLPLVLAPPDGPHCVVGRATVAMRREVNDGASVAASSVSGLW